MIQTIKLDASTQPIVLDLTSQLAFKVNELVQECNELRSIIEQAGLSSPRGTDAPKPNTKNNFKEE